VARRRKNESGGNLETVTKYYPAPAVISSNPTEELGVSGFRTAAGVIYEERLTRLTPERMRETFRQMVDTDPVIGAIMLAIEQTMRSVEWKVDPEDESDQAKRDADFIYECMDDMSHTWQDFISDVLTMLTYGWAAFEIVYKYRMGGSEYDDPTLRSRYRDGRLGWRKFGYRSQLTLWRWAIDPDGGLRGMYQVDPNQPGRSYIFIPIRKMLLFRTKHTGGSPEGRSILRPALRPWYFKKFIEELEGIGVERDLVGIPKLIVPDGVDIYAPQNQSLFQRLERIIDELRADRAKGIILPPGFDIQLVSGGGGRPFDTGAIIARYDQRIAMSVLAQFITLGSERVGSYALASQQKDLFTTSLEGWLRAIEEVINRYAVARLMWLNRMPTLPRISHYPVLRPTLTELSAFLRDTVNVGLITPDADLERWLRQAADLPVRNESQVEESVVEEQRRDTVSKVAWYWDRRHKWGPSLLDVIYPRSNVRILSDAVGEERAERIYNKVRETLTKALTDGMSKDDALAAVNAAFKEVDDAVQDVPGEAT
jgi:hypothetical protein